MPPRRSLARIFRLALSMPPRPSASGCCRSVLRHEVPDRRSFCFVEQHLVTPMARLRCCWRTLVRWRQCSKTVPSWCLNQDGSVYVPCLSTARARPPSASPSVAAVKSEASSYWRTVTLPFPEPGIRLLPQKSLGTLATELQRRRGSGCPGAGCNGGDQRAVGGAWGWGWGVSRPNA